MLNSYEYIFVTTDEYGLLKKKSKSWDHSEIAGNYYGADVSEYNELLSKGKNIICCVAPDLKIIDQMSFLYCVKPVLIWIDTDLIVANKRLIDSKLNGRAAGSLHYLQNEENTEKIKSKTDYIFAPKGSLKEDSASFVELIKKIIS